jgi:hypothetical protein
MWGCISSSKLHLHSTGGEGYYFPPSLYLWKRLLGVADHRRYQYHICKEDCHRFKQIPESAWKAAAESGEVEKALCPVCKSPRFKLVRKGRKNVWQPFQVRFHVFWRFCLHTRQAQFDCDRHRIHTCMSNTFLFMKLETDNLMYI